jgi:hypothetical protein
MRVVVFTCGSGVVCHCLQAGHGGSAASGEEPGCRHVLSNHEAVRAPRAGTRKAPNVVISSESNRVAW